MSDQAKTCGTCKHWESDSGWLHQRPCRAILSDADMTATAAVQALAIITDHYMDGTGLLLTRADFGCVLHEPKEAASE